jgi:hypothetical protein
MIVSLCVNEQGVLCFVRSDGEGADESRQTAAVHAKANSSAVHRKRWEKCMVLNEEEKIQAQEMQNKPIKFEINSKMTFVLCISHTLPFGEKIGGIDEICKYNCTAMKKARIRCEESDLG